MSQYNQCTTLGGAYPVLKGKQIIGRFLIIFGIGLIFQSNDWVKSIIAFVPDLHSFIGFAIFTSGLLFRMNTFSITNLIYRINRSLLYVGFYFSLLSVINFIRHFQDIGFWKSLIPFGYSLFTMFIFCILLALRMFLLKDERM